MPSITYNIKTIADVGSIDKDGICDVLGVIIDNGSLDEITVKATSKQLKKRELTIADQSQATIKVTLWGKSAENWVDSEKGIFAFKGCKVGEFGGGKTLSCGAQATMAADPDIPEAHELRGW